MNNLIASIKYLVKYFENFGFEGIKFLLKKKFSGSGIISIKPPDVKHPVLLRRNTSDVETFDQIFLYKEYDINTSFQPKVILDCGANIGLAAVYFKNKYPDAKVISIEPEQSNFDQLKKNTAGYQDVYPVQYGIWNRSANLVIEEDNKLGEWGFTVKEVEYTNDHTIKGVSLADLMTEFGLTGIDILKIDIEGSEKELFDSNFEQWLPLTKVLIIELHDRTRWGSSKSFFKALVNYDFSITHRGENIICCMNKLSVI
ncbi:FkbM family methyltransferase [Hufsiella ginkgonis]|uniref:FkbM family methyltransferase n=1 Tax=Hufsiella ginkgonis TaxID=2695274 RepID=A0A7K1XYV8_9SPHI|nr:FkbM family methyltransferase [Hufsiella ginkgonis]MXV16175.1 FkbM family methyltransferase [Hufsiella ginkgonis]